MPLLSQASIEYDEMHTKFVVKITAVESRLDEAITLLDKLLESVV